jgi:Ca2+:H+ antiporter
VQHAVEPHVLERVGAALLAHPRWQVGVPRHAVDVERRQAAQHVAHGDSTRDRLKRGQRRIGQRALDRLLAALIAVEAELVSGALEATSTSLGLSQFFLGVTVLAVVGNAAEYVSAVYFARRDRMGLVFTITVGATVQVALLTAPVLVIVSYFMGHPMNLVFENPIELIAIAAVAFAVNAIAHDGETTWFEGLLLLAVYVILGMAFYFVR